MNAYKVSRNAIQYGGGLCSKIDGMEAIEDAKKFLEMAEEHCRK